MNQEKIGKFIAECRKSKKFTQSELAGKLGVTEKSISNWENGRNMPDLSLFKPLCDELEISINELISGEKINDKEYFNKSEENIINTLDYSSKRINNKNNFIGVILIVFGVLISITAFSIFPSESSWGSIYSILGVIISFIGIRNFTKNLNYIKRIVCNFLYFVFCFSFLLIVDYISVVTIHQAPRFSYKKTFFENMIIYESLGFNVYRINYDTNNEYYIIDRGKEYDKTTVPNTPFNREKSGIDTIIKYKSKYVGDNSNNGALIGHLPISEYGYVFEIDSDNLGLTINYHITDWYINENYYLERSLLYNSVSIFALIDNVKYINFNFSGKTYNITRKQIIEFYPNFNDIIKKGIDKENFNIYLENKISDDIFVNYYFKELFIDDKLTGLNKIEVYVQSEVIKNFGGETESIFEYKLLKTISSTDKINDILNIISRSERLDKNAFVNANGETWKIIMYDDEKIIYTFLVWYDGFIGFDTKEYKLQSKDIDKVSKILGIYW